MSANQLTKPRRNTMETFEISISGSIIIQADTLDDAIKQIDQTLGNVLTDWEVEAVL
jgi:hypothetical protein